MHEGAGIIQAWASRIRTMGAGMAKVRALFILLMAGMHPAGEAQVFKCVEEGRTSYQSMPCDGPPAKTWNVFPQATVEPGMNAGPRRVARSAGRSGLSGVRLRQRNGRPRVDACAKAREGREAAYRQAGLKRGFALSSHWDNRVHEACR